WVTVKGKTEAIKIYELLGQKGEAGELRETIAAYEDAFGAYVKRDFATAIAILEKHNADAPSAVLIDRCRAFQQTPPAADWRGVDTSMSQKIHWRDCPYDRFSIDELAQIVRDYLCLEQGMFNT